MKKKSSPLCITQNISKHLISHHPASYPFHKPYELVGRIDAAITNSLGIDAKKDLRNATATLAAIEIPAKRDVAYFKLQVAEDFKTGPGADRKYTRLCR
jgi:hypothetical protein